MEKFFFCLVGNYNDADDNYFAEIDALMLMPSR